MIEKHYCFNTEQLEEVWGRIHVPLAKVCSLNCVYCGYHKDCNITSNIWRPGTVSGTVEGKQDIYKYLQQSFDLFQGVKIIGVSGPGDPLENMSQMRNLVTIMCRYFPQMYLCMCTNGSVYNSDTQWLLNQPILRYITLTVNTMDSDKYPLIYRRYCNPEIPRDMLDNQLKIIHKCVKNKIKVKVNTIYLQGVNDQEISGMFDCLLKEGVSCFNLIPRVNTVTGRYDCQKNFEKLQKALIDANYPLMTRCKQCRADYCECGF